MWAVRSLPRFSDSRGHHGEGVMRVRMFISGAGAELSTTAAVYVKNSAKSEPTPNIFHYCCARHQIACTSTCLVCTSKCKPQTCTTCHQCAPATAGLSSASITLSMKRATPLISSHGSEKIQLELRGTIEHNRSEKSATGGSPTIY